MPTSNLEKEVVLACGPSCGTDGSTTMKLQPDERGWPSVRFEPPDPALCLVGDFLRSDVDIVLPGCDLLIDNIRSVLVGQKPRWRWNGNSFIVEVDKPTSRLKDKYGHLVDTDRTASIPTQVLLEIVLAWREFVADLPRQREMQYG